VKVRIGLSMAPREIEIEVEEPEALVAAIDQALQGGQPMVWVTDRQGRRHGLSVEKIAFIEIESGGPKPVGFTAV